MDKYVNPFIKNLTYCLIELSRALINIESNENQEYISNSYSAIAFKNTFINSHSSFSARQHDAIEFIRALLDDISKETRRNKIIAKYE